MDKYLKLDGPSAVSASMTDDYIKVKRGSGKEKSMASEQDRVEDFAIAVMDRDDNLRYGWFGYTPDWLQWCCTPRFMLASLMLIAIAQGFFVHGVIPTSFKPLHAQFGFDIELGLIRMMYDLGMIAAFVPVMFFEAKGAKRPVWLGVSCIVMSVGAFACAVPHIFTPPCIPSTGAANFTQTCSNLSKATGDFLDPTTTTTFPTTTSTMKTSQPNATMSNASSTTKASNVAKLLALDKTDSTTSTPGSSETGTDEPTPTDLKPYLSFFIIGVFLNGFGAAFYFSMSIAFVDENVDHRTSVMYTGALSCALIFGVGLGFYVNASIVQYVFVDVTTELPSSYDKENPPHWWIGAWWIGMILAGSLTMVVAFPMFGFPRELPGATKAHILDVFDVEETIDQRGAMDVAQGIWASFLDCVKDMTFLGLVLEQITQVAIVSAFTTVLPIYLKTVFGLEQFSNWMTGMVVLCAVVGASFGTYLQDRFNLTVMGNLRFAFATSAVSLFFLGGFFVRCYHFEYAGWSESFPVTGSTIFGRGNGTCNSACACNVTDHLKSCYRGPHPTRRDEQIVFIYQSPCLAGCAEADGSEGYNCRCVPRNGTMGVFEGGGSVTDEKCKSRKCLFRAMATTLLFCWCAMFMFARLNPMQHCLLRCLPLKERSVGLTMSALLSRLLGALPPPVIIGLIMKNACKVQIQQAGSETKYCIWRDGDNVSLGVGVFSLITFVLGTIGLALAYVDHERKSRIAHAKPPASEKNRSPLSEGKRSEGKRSPSNVGKRAPPPSKVKRANGNK